MKNPVLRNNHPRRPTAVFRSKAFVCFVWFLSLAVSFQAGVFVGVHQSDHERSDAHSLAKALGCPPGCCSSSTQQQEQQRRMAREEPPPQPTNHHPPPPPFPKPGRDASNAARKDLNDLHAYMKDYLRDRFKKGDIFLPSSEFVDRDEFVTKFESLGVPWEKSESPMNQRVQILYGDKRALPEVEIVLEGYQAAKFNHTHRNDGPDQEVRLSVDQATKNCNSLQVVLASPYRPQQCLALVGQLESFHVHKLLRASPEPVEGSVDKYALDPSFPLRPVNRHMKLSGDRYVGIPGRMDLEANWKALGSYLGALDGELKRLEPLAKRVARHNARNAVIVMVTNFGQSELLVNFVCNARARGFEKELRNILVFSTDQETHDLATNVLGLTSFYSPEIFGSIPKEAAGEYGDDIYQQIMMSKVYCVHLVSMLGHDLLFQDVDLIWYRNPLEWFHNESNAAMKEYDLIFQDDGARTIRYTPYDSNTGFYYAKNNVKTQAFFNGLLLAGDMVLTMFSHQQALVAVMSEHASLYNLRVKVWVTSGEEFQFPGGQIFNERRDLMAKFIKNQTNPYIFHMSWTTNKEEKVKYMQQMGHWYLEDTCRNQSKENLFQSHKNEDAKHLLSKCCAANPLITCHYRDKPSIIPCPEAPKKDKEEKDFWSKNATLHW